ncbi:kanamycin kinase [Novispirillum itersonii]|uniref:Kanamycin kinase n=1 Tax=Novispirillum itersonii TaxID=189 RepID=A0A7X0DNQ6_NOVIT|nr:kanamycin kinase [Novispirillum itersonii]
MLRWLAGRLSVPEVVATAETDHGAFMITRALPGDPLFTRIDAGKPVEGLFLEALRLVQAVPVAECPFDAGVFPRLTELDYLLAQGLAAEDIDLSPWPGLTGPEDLRAHLHATRPAEDSGEDPVFSHGDLGDSNILIDSRETLHFIDLGRGGRADRWLDIAFLCRNLREEVSAEAEQAFLRQLGRPDAPDRRRFFEQLDELF